MRHEKLSPVDYPTKISAIFAHPGVKPPPGILDAQQLLLSPVEPLQIDRPSGIPELARIWTRREQLLWMQNHY